MASVLAQLRQEIRNRIPSLRWGKVGMGWGGTLAGYNQQLRKKRYDLLSELYQKQYEAGEIDLEALIKHLESGKTMPWISTEEKKLIDQSIKDLKTQQQDKAMQARYEAKEITAQEMLTYHQKKLATMTPGSPVYETQQAMVTSWQKLVNSEKRKLYATQEQTRIYAQTAGEMTPEDYDALATMFDQLAQMATQDSLPQEAAEYQQSAAQARDNAEITRQRKTEEEQAEAERATTKQVKEAREDLVGKINLAINAYHDETITTARFFALLDEYQAEAIQTGNTDLLIDMNRWVDTAIQGKGTISEARRVGAGAGSPISATSGMSWDEEDAQYESVLREIKQAFATGQRNNQLYDATDYAQDLLEISAIRKDELEERTAWLASQNPESKVGYDGAKQQVDNLYERFEKELNEIDSVTLPASMDLARGLGSGQWSYVVTESETGVPQVKLMPTPEGVGTLYLPDETGRLHQVQRELIADLTADEIAEAQANSVAGMPTTVERDGKLYRVTTRNGRFVAEGGYYVDIWNPEIGQRVRYVQDENTGSWLPQDPKLQEQWNQVMGRMTDVQKERYAENPVLFSPLGLEKTDKWITTLYGVGAKPAPGKEIYWKEEPSGEITYEEREQKIPSDVQPTSAVEPPKPVPAARYVPAPEPTFAPQPIVGPGGMVSEPYRVESAPSPGGVQIVKAPSPEKLSLPEPIPQAPKGWEPIKLGPEYAPPPAQPSLKREEPWTETIKKAVSGLATKIFGLFGR